MSSVQVNFFSSQRAKSVRHQKADTYSHPELIAASAGEGDSQWCPGRRTRAESGNPVSRRRQVSKGIGSKWREEFTGTGRAERASLQRGLKCGWWVTAPAT